MNCSANESSDAGVCRAAVSQADARSDATPVLVICYGNPLRADDGAGWRVADLLEAQLKRISDQRARFNVTRASCPCEVPSTGKMPVLQEHAPTDQKTAVMVVGQSSTAVPPLRVIRCHQLMPELSDDASRSRLVIFVDAEEGVSAGAIRESPIAPSPVVDGRPMTHHLSPAALLALSRDLFGRYPQAVLLTIGGADFSLREQLSEPVANACRQVADRIWTMVCELPSESARA